MKITGIKIVCEQANKDITTWHDVYETSVEDTINKVKHQKNKKHRKKLEIVSLELIFNHVRIKNSKNKLICIIFHPFR